ncbi:MAG TPA: hypothetical protein VIF60_25225 [Burkholderiaceae bacterium]
MTFAMQSKQFLCVLMLATAGLASGSAMAQSQEYRRGYDQGYRDGAEAQSQADRGGQRGRIVIEEAHYGSREGGFCEAREALQRMAGWRRHLDILADNNLCGDPAHGIPKHLDVRYRCGDSQPMRAEAHEGEMLALNCE